MTPPTLDVTPLPTNPDDDSDIFGPPRTNVFRSSRPRVSMISAKLRAKEERKRVIQICTEKLERIKDPDTNLRRSVCINNTYYKLQDEVRREKQNKLSVHSSQTSNNSCCESRKQKCTSQRLLDNDLERIDNELRALNESLDRDMYGLNEDIAIRPAAEVLQSFHRVGVCTADYNTRKRVFEEVDDRVVQEVLSHFYNQPTTKLLTSIDEDAMLSSENKKLRLDKDFDIDMLSISTDLNQNKAEFETLNETPAPCKKLKVDICEEEKTKAEVKTDFEIILDALRLNNENKDISERENMMCLGNSQDYDSKRFLTSNTSMDSCGQAAIFADLQSTVFHNLMASLET